MLAVVLAVALAHLSQSAASSSESIALGERLARAGLLAGFISVAGAAEAKGIVDLHPELSPEQRSKAEAVSRAALADAGAEVAHAEGQAFAAAMTPDQLRSAVRFFESSAGVAYRAAFPRILISVTQTAPAKDFKGYVTKRLCAEAKVCPPAQRP